MPERTPIRQAIRATLLLAPFIWLIACSSSPALHADTAIKLGIGEATVVMTVHGDADGDGDADVLVVTEHERGDRSDPRRLLVFLRGPDGSLTEVVDSPNAILCRACGGMMGDPLQRVSAGKGELMLRFEGGSRELWSSDYSFAYVPERKQWRLVKIVHQGLDRLAETSSERKPSLPAGSIFLDSFDPADYPADAIP